LTIVDALLLARLPFAGGEAELVGALLAAGLLNLIVVAVAGPVVGHVIRRRRQDLPREVASDHAAVGGMVVLALLLAGGGLAHRPAKQAHDRQRATAVERSRAYAQAHAPARFRPVTMRDVWDQGGDLWRTCFAGRDPQRDYCVFVRFDGGRPVVRHDPDETTNVTMAGPFNRGRISR
jgi:hypothetical protein